MRPWRIAGWIGVVLVVVLSLVPELPGFTSFDQQDKVGHTLAYAVLMVWFAQIHLARAARWRVAAGLLALGVGLEFVQGWGGVRMFSYADMAGDAAGIVLGWIAAPPRGPNLLRAAARVWPRPLGGG